MDSLFFARLQKYIVSKIDEEIAASPSAVSKVLVLIAEFVETVPGLEKAEKAFLSLTWLKQLIPSLTDSEISFCSAFLQRIIESAEGCFNISNGSTSSNTSTPLVVAMPVANVNAVTPTPQPKPSLKKAKSIWKKGSCLDPTPDNASK